MVEAMVRSCRVLVGNNGVVVPSNDGPGGDALSICCVSARMQIQPKFGLKMGPSGQQNKNQFVCVGALAPFFVSPKPNGCGRKKWFGVLDLTVKHVMISEH